MKRITIIFHSTKGHTRKLAEAVYDAIIEGAVAVCALIEVKHGEKINWDILARSDAIIFGSPTYMGTVSAVFKDFMDQSGELGPIDRPFERRD